jgi:high-affinity iron transporter
VFDWSSSLPTHGLIGSVLAGILGYTDAPTISELVAYFGYLIPTMFLFLSGSKVKQELSPTQVSNRF